MKHYQYKGCGLDNVFLQNGFEIVKTPYGTGVTIHDLPGLHAAIADAIITSPEPMNSNEFRFIRHELEFSQESLAAYIGKNVQTVARWEKGKTGIDPLAERLMRCIYAGIKNKNQPILDMLKTLESERVQSHRFLAGENKKKWGVTVAA